MTYCIGQASLADLLDDPLTHILMRRDGVTPHELQSLLDRVRPAVAGSATDRSGRHGLHRNSVPTGAEARISASAAGTGSL